MKIIISIVALIVSAITAIIAIRSNIISKKSAQVSSELLIQQLISGAKKDLQEFAYTIKKGDEKQLFLAYVEQELNVYDVACASYLDGKIDKERFKKTYISEIRNIFENKEMFKIANKNGRYYALKKVYDEWNNLEK
jgi:hypothetical protein